MVFTNKVLNKKIIFLFSKFLVPLHYQELFDRSVLQIAEFTTVAKSLPYSKYFSSQEPGFMAGYNKLSVSFFSDFQKQFYNPGCNYGMETPVYFINNQSLIIRYLQ